VDLSTFRSKMQDFLQTFKNSEGGAHYLIEMEDMYTEAKKLSGHQPRPHACLQRMAMRLLLLLP